MTGDHGWAARHAGIRHSPSSIHEICEGVSERCVPKDERGSERQTPPPPLCGFG